LIELDGHHLVVRLHDHTLEPIVDPLISMHVIAQHVHQNSNVKTTGLDGRGCRGFGSDAFGSHIPQGLAH